MKYILLTDIHFGEKSNSDEHNKSCLDFLNFVEESTTLLRNSKNYGGAIFLGDWIHTRNSVNVKTLNYSVEGLYTLGNIGNGKSYMILGNHDLYYRDRRDVHSIIIPEGDIGVQIIDEPLMIENMLFIPWLIGNEKISDMIKQYKPEYIFCHPEIPSFSFNKKVKYDGEFNPAEYQGPKRICCGHFHLRQEKNNITYIGNCFSHNFADANDWHNKGFAILDTDTNIIEYKEWIDAPKYCVTNISQLDKIELLPNMNLKLINDINATSLELNQIQEQLEQLPQISTCIIYPNELALIQSETEIEKLEHIDNIDTLIIELLSSLDMENVNNTKLIEIYRNL